MAENLNFAREMAKVDNAEIRVLESKPTYPFEKKGRFGMIITVVTCPLSATGVVLPLHDRGI